jgi:hypothetical protein
MSIRKKVALFLGFLFCGSGLLAQPYTSDKVPDDLVAPTAIGIAILGNPALGFNSVNDFKNGISVDHTTLQLSLSVGLSWSVQVRATGDLQYQSYSIPVSALGIQALSAGNRSEFKLSTTNQTLLSGLLTTLLSLTVPIRYHAIGGADFLKPGGGYTTTLVFTLTAL